MSDAKLSFQSLIEGAFTLAAALAWNEAAKSIVNRVVPSEDSTDDLESQVLTPEERTERAKKLENKKIKANVIYAVIVTLFVLIIFFAWNTTRKAVKTIADKIAPSKLSVLDIMDLPDHYIKNEMSGVSGEM